MSGNGKNLLVIIDELKEFAEKSLSLLADESDENNERLISIIKKALVEYQKSINFMVTGWVHQFTKVRCPDIEQVIKELKEGTTDSAFRLRKFKSLMEKGEWHKDSSFNYFLFDELIHAVPGYKAPAVNSIEVIVDRLKNLLITRVDGFVKQYETNQILVQNQIKERQVALQREQKSFDFILLANDLKTAKSSAMARKDQTQFCIYSKNNSLNLAWVDGTGRSYALDATDEMVKLLASQVNQDVEALPAVYQKRLKKECMKSRDEFLKKTQLLINPKDSATNQPLDNSVLINNGVSSTFVLRGEPDCYSLYWINSLSQANEIKLKQYPDFITWLNSVKTLTEEHTQEIKTYLLHIKTAKDLGQEDFKRDLTNCLLRKRAEIKCEPVEEKKSNKIDISLFANLEACLGKRGEKPSPGKLKVEQFAVASLFGHKQKDKAPPCGDQMGVSTSP